MDLELLKDIILMSMLLEIIMIVVIITLQMKVYHYRRKIYFIKRDRERCNELIYSAKDGYFCFIYPDQKIRDTRQEIREHCSKRLAVMLNLKDGTAASFADVIEAFPKDDARLLRKYVTLLKQEGLAFEDLMHLKGGKRTVCVYGSRVNGSDNNLYCDIIWIREVTAEADKIEELENEKAKVQDRVKQFENMVDGINYPVWLRDENLKLLAVNKKYAEYCGVDSKKEILSNNIELKNNKGEMTAQLVAAEARKSKKIQKKAFNMVRRGGLYNFELYENPYFIGDELDKIGTVGYLSNNTELEKLKRSFKVNQNNHLEILGTLGTAFAIFDEKMNLFFYNNAFRNLWGLDGEFLDNTPSYPQFLELIREHKILPPVPDFKAYKDDEMSIFGNLFDTKEDLLHLPDGRTIRRFRSPHPNGVIFAFEDVSDRLATMRRLNDLTSIQQDILDNLSDSVVIFGANQRLKFYNRSYLKLWGIDHHKVQDEPKLERVISQQKLFFSNIDDWDGFKSSMINNITEGRKFSLTRDDDSKIDVSPHVFYDGSVMITYTKK